MKLIFFIIFLIKNLNGNNILRPERFNPPSRANIESKNETELNDEERMLAGLPYNANNINLINGRIFAKEICQKFNNMGPLSQRDEVLKELLGTYSKGNYIEPPFYCDYGSNIHLGENVYMNHGCILLDVNEIKIGKNTLLGPNVQIYTAGHPTDPILRRKTEFGKAITIGRDTWIGGGAIILPGVTIGDGVTIGAGSVVTKNIDSFTVAVGNPAKIIKRLNKTILND